MLLLCGVRFWVQGSGFRGACVASEFWLLGRICGSHHASMTHREPRSANRCRGEGGGALAGQASSSARRALARTRHPKSLATRRVALVVRSGMSRQTLEDSLRSGTPFPRSLPTRRWSTVLSLFPSALICCAGRMEKCLCFPKGATHLRPPQPFFPRPPLRSSLRGGRGTSQRRRQACRRERGRAPMAPTAGQWSGLGRPGGMRQRLWEGTSRAPDAAMASPQRRHQATDHKATASGSRPRGDENSR